MKNDDYRWINLETGEARLVTGDEEKQIRRKRNMEILSRDEEKPNTNSQDNADDK